MGVCPEVGGEERLVLVVAGLVGRIATSDMGRDRKKERKKGRSAQGADQGKLVLVRAYQDSRWLSGGSVGGWWEGAGGGRGRKGQGGGQGGG